MELIYLRLFTFCLALVVGVSLLVVSKHLRIPAIVPLLIGGIILGPDVLNIIDPSVFGNQIQLLVSVCVAVILFEGGLTLDPKGFQTAPKVIWRLLTIGVLVTWFGTAIAVHLLFEFDVEFSLLIGSLIIVTGPTVITPLLHRIQLKEKLHHILHWEGVMIDPIGVFIAILCVEWVLVGDYTIASIQSFGLRMAIGLGVGTIGGYLIYKILQKKIVQVEYGNIFVLSMSLFLLSVSDVWVHESGILTVIVAGLVLGVLRPEQLKNLRQFKSEMTDLAIALVFIMLASQLQLSDFANFGVKGIILVFIILLVIRPLSVFLCSIGTSLSLQDRLFLSWMAPRGIIAASMASLFAFRLSEVGNENSSFLQAFTFSVIGATVIFQGLSASAVANLLKVKAKEKKGWLIVGGHFFARKIAQFIMETSRHSCILIDTNADAIRECEEEDFLAFQANALDIEEAVPAELLLSIGNVLALTDNRDLNQLICEKLSEIAGREKLYRWSSGSIELEKNIGGLGVPLWQSLPKPSQVAYDIKHHQSTFVKVSIRSGNVHIPQGSIPLLWYEKDQFSFEQPKFEHASGEVIIFHESLSSLPFFIAPEHVFTYNDPTLSAEHLIQKLLNVVQQQAPDLPIEHIQKEIEKRELTFPTILGNEVAVPHFSDTQLRTPICLIARIPQGMAWFNQANIRVVFLLLSPATDAETHLMILSEIAKIASKSNIIQHIMDLATSQDVLHYILEMER